MNKKQFQTLIVDHKWTWVGVFIWTFGWGMFMGISI